MYVLYLIDFMYYPSLDMLISFKATTKYPQIESMGFLNLRCVRISNFAFPCPGKKKNSIRANCHPRCPQTCCRFSHTKSQLFIKIFLYLVSAITLILISSESITRVHGNICWDSDQYQYKHGLVVEAGKYNRQTYPQESLCFYSF